MPTSSSVKGKHCCGLKIIGFPIEALTKWHEADVESLSGELGMAVFKREAHGIGRKSPREGEKWE